MNFFTKPIVYSDMAPTLLCEGYIPGLYNDVGHVGTILDGFKLNHQHKALRMFDPMILVGAFFYNDNWEEGWDLIGTGLEEFLNSEGPLMGTQPKLDTKENRIQAFKAMQVHPMFIRIGVRLEIIRLIENLE